MRLIDNIIITTSLLAVIAGFTSGHLWGSLLVLAGVVGTIYTYRAAARRDYPEGFINAIPNPEDFMFMFNFKKED